MVWVDAQSCVSIRARSLQSGRPQPDFGWQRQAVFQSAPALCRAGDVRIQYFVQDCASFQSAPALCRAGDRPSCWSPSNTICFNPRPLFAERATRLDAVFADLRRVSIRARSLQSGRPALMVMTLLAILVSIRARSLQSGRHIGSTRSAQSQAFQSAPALCRAGDALSAWRLWAHGRFQSAPALCRAGDSALSSCCCESRRTAFRANPSGGKP